MSANTNTTNLHDVGGSWMAHALASELQEKEDLRTATHLQQEQHVEKSKAQTHQQMKEENLEFAIKEGTKDVEDYGNYLLKAHPWLEKYVQTVNEIKKICPDNSFMGKEGDKKLRTIQMDLFDQCPGEDEAKEIERNKDMKKKTSFILHGKSGPRDGTKEWIGIKVQGAYNWYITTLLAVKVPGNVHMSCLTKKKKEMKKMEHNTVVLMRVNNKDRHLNKKISKLGNIYD